MNHRAVLPLIAALCLTPRAAPADEPGAEFFAKQVRPILVARCYECHSGKSDQAKGGLRLDVRELAFKGGDTGRAVVPSQPKNSLLIDAINYGDLYQMPPKSRLPAEEVAVLTRWVEMGAPWPADAAPAATSTGAAFDLAQRKAEHWCWRPIKRPPLPAVKNEVWPCDPIDRFILATLEANGMSPTPQADQRTLIRRAYFDITGLPPPIEAAIATSPPPLLAPSASPEEESRREEQYEALIDRLLASPRFGERWGRHWLDLVRYAESRGHEFDYTIPNAAEYRDYVIRALNADLPYDRFLTEHIAGDLVPQPRLHPTQRWNESILGTGFWWLGEWVHSPVDIRKDQCDRVDNQLDVFSKTFLGLTVACARCHDHKFDAISQRDYYALAGYMQSSSYRQTRFETWEGDRDLAARLTALDEQFKRKIATAIAGRLRPEIDRLANALAADAAAAKPELGVMEVDLRGAEIIVDYARLAPGQWMADGPTFGTGPVLPGQIVLTGDKSSPLEVATSGAARRDWNFGELTLSKRSENDPGRLNSWLRAGRTLKSPTFALQSGYVHYLIEGEGHVYAAVAGHAMINGPLHAELVKDTGGNSDLPTRWITHDLSRYVGQRVHLEFSPADDEDLRVLMVVEGRERPAAPTLRPNRLLPNESQSDGAARACRDLIQQTLDALAADRLAADAHAPDRAALANWLLARLPDSDRSSGNLSQLLAEHEASRGLLVGQIQAASRLAPAMWEGTAVDEYVLIRGNHRTPGAVAPRALLEALEETGDRGQETGDRKQGTVGSGRLELAQTLIDKRNPLVSRVIVNRVWQHLLGRGIVPSVDNFGVLGQKPTHPELLDYLAAEFMHDGWSLKRLIRRILLSSTYRQSSRILDFGLPIMDSNSSHNPQSLIPNPQSLDPQNLLFHHQSLKRLEGESLRDAILAVSGRLDPSMFGPSVPIYLTPFMQGRGRPKDSGPLDGAGRRSVYIAVRRNFLSPLMLAFDTPLPFTTIGRRNVSNVPAQALILMNDPFVAEQAQLWARRTLADPAASPGSLIRQMYLAAFTREPTDRETAAALDFLRQQAGEYGLSGDTAFRDERPWTDLAHVLYNTKEFILVE